MKRLYHILALILVITLSLAVLHFSSILPADTQPLIEKKYHGWSGVLRGWVSVRWHCDGSFIKWLNNCASAFEQDHPGVYLEFITVSEQAMNEAGSANIRMPELLFFSPGVLHSSYLEQTAWAHPNPAFQDSVALPLCMGAYINVLCNDFSENKPLTLYHLQDDPGRHFSHAVEGLRSTGQELDLTDPAIDLGLPVSRTSTVPAELDAFIEGEIPSLVVSQLELAHLQRLRDAGRGPDWRCELSGTYMYADQLLLGGVTTQQDANADDRIALANAFLQFLLSEACQQQLATIGAFPVIELAIYPPGSVYAEMEVLLRSLPLMSAAVL